MQELIKVSQNEKGIETVSARDLHEFLESKHDFTNWFKYKIESLNLIEAVDYERVYAKISENPLGGRPMIDYYITIDIAKTICLLSKTDKGKSARQYFIDVEKRAKELEVSKDYSIPATYAEALQLAANQAKYIEENQDKIEAANALLHTDNDGYDSITTVSKRFGLKSRKQVFPYLKKHGLITKCKKNMPTQKAIDLDLLSIRSYDIGNGDTVAQAYVNENQLDRWRTYLVPRIEKEYHDDNVFQFTPKIEEPTFYEIEAGV